MSNVKFKYFKLEYDGTPLEELCGGLNNPSLPGGIIEKLVEEFVTVNGIKPSAGDTILIPILPPFQKKYGNLLDQPHLPEPEPEPVIEVIPEDISEPVVEAEPEPVAISEPVVETPREVVAPTQPKKTKTGASVIEKTNQEKGTMKFKLFPYTFSRPGETIEAVIRLYNDMSAGPSVMKKLVYEFTKANMDALPPKLGQTVQVPVLLPFVYRHVNKNKIFKDV